MMQIITPGSVQKGTSRHEATLRIHHAGGFSLSKLAAWALKIKVGDQLTFSHDHDKNLYYVAKSAPGATGFKVRNDKGKNYMFNSSGLAAKIRDSYSIEHDKKSILFTVEIHIPVTNFGTTFFKLKANF